MLEHALEYAHHGWPVFPIQHKKKTPFPGTRGCLEATTDEKRIRAWWETYPDANIGLGCGVGQTPIYVLDIDKNSGGFESIAKHGAPTETLTTKTPGGGLHLFYYSETPVPNANAFLPGVDVRGKGYYVLLPPSIHPNGGRYKWGGQHEIAQYPDAYRKPERDAPQTMPFPAPFCAQGGDVTARASLYLSRCEAATQGQAGHDKLLWAATVLVNGFAMSESDAVAMLWREFNPRCNPPWNPENPADCKDFERKVREAAKHPIKPHGWLLQQQWEGSYNDVDRFLADAIATSLLASEEFVEEKEVQEPVPEPASDILSPPGLVGEICDWILSTAGCPQPLLTVGAVLTAFGAIVGRKVRDLSNGRTNLYMMGVAHSSAGKDHPSDCMQQLITAAGGDLILGSRVTSDSAIELALVESPVKLFIIDEVGHFFANISNGQGMSGGGSHMKSIVPLLMELYSSAHKLFVGKQRADTEARRIDQPHVCVWGNTAPDVFFSSLSRAEIRDGWLGRVITLISDDRPKYEIVAQEPPPKMIVDKVRLWLHREIESDVEGDIAQVLSGGGQILVETMPEALDIFNNFRDFAYDRMLECDKKGDDSQFLWGKALQQARSIALTVAAGCKPFNRPVITGDVAQWAVDFVAQAVFRFAEAIKNHVSESEHEATKQRILRLVLGKKEKGMSKAELTRKTQFIRDRQTRNQYIADLVEAKRMIIGIHESHQALRSGWLWAGEYMRGAPIARSLEEGE